MSYYGQFIHRQAELTQATMAQARKALLAEGEAEALYRQELEDQITELQKMESLYKKSLKKLGAFDKDEQLKMLKFEADLQNKSDTRRHQRARLVVDLKSRADFNASGLERSRADFALSASDSSPTDTAVGLVIDQAGAPGSGMIHDFAKDAQRIGEAATIDYAIKLAKFLENRLVEGGHEITETHRTRLKAAAAKLAGTPTQTAADVDHASKEEFLGEETKKITDLMSNAMPALLEKLKELEARSADPTEIKAVRGAIEIKMGSAGAQREEIEAQLEALGRPMEVTEEAVRGRTQEMMEPYEGMTPFPIAAALGERFKKRMQERRGEKAVADFDDLSDDQQIIFQNAIKAEQWRTDLGGRLPSEDQMNTIEWKRARDIMRLVESGELPKTAMIRTALQFAEKDLGRGAPPTDVRRQRDEIIERVMMLRANTTAMGKANVKPPPPRERPKPVVEPAAPAPAAPAGTGRGSAPPTPSMDDYLASDAAMAGSALLPDTPVSTFAVGESPEFPMHGPEEAPTGSAVADVLVPPQNLGETPFAEQYPTSPLTTQSFQRPEELGYPGAPKTAPVPTRAYSEGEIAEIVKRYGTTPFDAEKHHLGDPTRPLRLPQETMDIEDVIAGQGGEMGAGMLESQARQFVASSSADEISRDSRVLNALAQEALRLGLPLPTWYTAQIRPTVPTSIAR